LSEILYLVGLGENVCLAAPGGILYLVVPDEFVYLAELDESVCLDLVPVVVGVLGMSKHLVLRVPDALLRELLLDVLDLGLFQHLRLWLGV